MSDVQQRKTSAGKRGRIYGKEQDVKCCACILEAVVTLIFFFFLTCCFFVLTSRAAL